MTCRVMKLASGEVAIVCDGKRKKVPRVCAFCERPTAKLCDFVLEKGIGHARSKTCDKPLCDMHVVAVGENRDHCPDHPLATGAGVQGALDL